MKTIPSPLACALLALTTLPAVAAAASEYDNMFVDTSLITVPTRSARDEMLKMLRQGESFQAMAVALSTHGSAGRGGRRGVATCFDFKDPGYAKTLCTEPLDTPIPLHFTHGDDWSITLIHGRADKPGDIGKRGFAVPLRGEPNALFACHNTADTQMVPLMVAANTVSRSGSLAKVRAYLQITPTQLVFLTGMGEQLVIERSSGRALMNHLESRQSEPYKCGPTVEQAPAESGTPAK